MIERLIFLRTHKEEAKRIKSKKSFIMRMQYTYCWTYFGISQRLEHNLIVPLSQIQQFFMALFFSFFRELSFGGITTSWCQPTKSLCHEVFKQYSNITTLQKPSMQFTATELQFMSKNFFSCHLILLLGSTISQLRVVGFLTRLM